jgi:hypothetical protein
MAQALRNAGIPEAYVAAVIDNPTWTEQLLDQNAGAGPVQTKSPAEAIGNDREAAIAALRGIPIAGMYADKAVARLNAAAQPWLETSLSHAGTFSERTAENERIIKAATDRFEKQHPTKTFVGQQLATSAALTPVAATALGGRLLGMTGEALLPSVLKAATTVGLLRGGDAALRGGDMKDIAAAALRGIGTGGAVPVFRKAAGAIAPLLPNPFNRSP